MPWVINPLGFTLEHFDAIGRYREKENDKAIDDSGSTSRDRVKRESSRE